MRHTAAIPHVRRQDQVPQRRAGSALLAGAALFLMAGCGNTPPGPVRLVEAPVVTNRTVSHMSGNILPPITQPSVADPFTSGADPLAGAGAKNPLVDPDQLSVTNDALDYATGPKMPTDHSHWLRGDIFNASVAVRLNGILLGEYSGHIDRDITMKLHAGVNTVTFTFHPLTLEAMAQLDLVESEHTPPIPPLAQFHPAAPGPGMSGPATTETVTFLAH